MAHATTEHRTAFPAFVSPPAIDIPNDARPFLNHLRFVAMGCRSMRRTDLFEACALLHVTKTATLQAHAEALMRCLHEALGKRPQLFAPGVVQTSFDEKWLVELGLACDRQDTNSVRFLLKSRVAPEHQRLVSFLMHRIAAQFF